MLLYVTFTLSICCCKKQTIGRLIAVDVASTRLRIWRIPCRIKTNSCFASTFFFSTWAPKKKIEANLKYLCFHQKLRSTLPGLTLGLWVSGPGLPESLKRAEQSFRLQCFLFHVCIILILLERPRWDAAAFWAALLGISEDSLNTVSTKSIKNYVKKMGVGGEGCAQTFLIKGKRISAMVLKRSSWLLWSTSAAQRRAATL